MLMKRLIDVLEAERKEHPLATGLHVLALVQVLTPILSLATDGDWDYLGAAFNDLLRDTERLDDVDTKLDRTNPHFVATGEGPWEKVAQQR